jgi:hypothetical protein
MKMIPTIPSGLRPVPTGLRCSSGAAASPSHLLVTRWPRAVFRFLSREGVAAAQGAAVTVDLIRGYPVIVNDADFEGFMLDTAPEDGPVWNLCRSCAVTYYGSASAVWSWHARTERRHAMRRILLASGSVVAMLFVVLAGVASAADVKVTLSGSQEVPAVTTSASGSGTITVGDDMSVSGSVMTTGIAGTAAHIHMAAVGQNGPVAVPLTKSGDGGWAVPAGTKLTDAQFAAFKAGNLYVNVHSESNKGGEIRGQLTP